MKFSTRKHIRPSLSTVGAEDGTGGGEVVYLLAELQSVEQGPVYEIGSRALVLEAAGERVTLAVGRGTREEIVTCPRTLVAPRHREARARGCARYRLARVA